MAIIDSHCILFEGPLSAESTGKAVPLTALRLPGRMEPMPLRISVTKGFAKEQTTSLALTLQEADSAEGEWQDVPGAAITVQGAELGEGARLGWRFVPQAVRKSWLRLKLSPAGSGSHDGHIFAALLREEDFPYERNCACASPFPAPGAAGPSHSPVAAPETGSCPRPAGDRSLIHGAGRTLAPPPCPT